MCGSEYPKNSGPLMAVFFSSSPIAARPAVARFRNLRRRRRRPRRWVRQAFVGSQFERGAVVALENLLDPSRAISVRFVAPHVLPRGAVPDREDVRRGVVPELVRGCTTPRHSRVTPRTGPADNRTRLSYREATYRSELGPFYLVHVAHCRVRVHAARSRAVRVGSEPSSRAGVWAPGAGPPTCRRARRTGAHARARPRFGGHSTATTSVEVKSIFAGDRSGFAFCSKRILRGFCGARRTG